MPPPELARDAPVADVLHPREVRVLPLLRDEARPAVAHRGERGERERLNLDEPLARDERLDDRPAAVADPDPVPVRLLPLEEAHRAEGLGDAPPALEAGEAGRTPGLRGHATVGADHRAEREPVALAQLP